jgi:hypothetical protein
MKDLENIDDLFSRSLENFQVPPPSDAKKAIENALHKKANKKSRKSGWLLLAIVSMSVLATAMFVQNKNIKKVATNITIENEKRDANAHHKIENHHSSDSKLRENKSNTKHVESIAKTNDNKQSLELNSENLLQNQQIANKNSVLKTISNRINTQDILTSQNTLNKAPERAVEANLSNSYNGSNNGNMESMKLVMENFMEQQNTSIEKEENNTDERNELITFKDSAIDVALENNAPIKIVEASSKSRSYFVAYNLGMGYNSNHFTNQNTIATQELKDSIQFNKPYYNVQLLGGMQLKKLAISTGISLFKQTEKTQYSYINQKIERILVDSIYIDAITHDTIVKHNVPVDTLMNSYQTNTNQTVYTSLQIPIILSYQILLGTRFTLDLSAGGAVNILLQSKGNYKVSATGTLADYQTKAKAPLQTFSYNALALLGLNYDLNGSTSLHFAIPFQIGLSNVYKKGYYIDKNVNSAGLQVGLKYNF